MQRITWEGELSYTVKPIADGGIQLAFSALELARRLTEAAKATETKP